VIHRRVMHTLKAFNSLTAFSEQLLPVRLLLFRFHPFEFGRFRQGQ
jgi:hypothetical protein